MVRKKGVVDEYNSWTVLELKDTLRENNLSTEGNKQQLIKRLRAAPVKEYSDYTIRELKDFLFENGLPTTGKKADLVARLEKFDEQSSESEEEDESEPERKLTGKKRARKDTKKDLPKSKKKKKDLKFNEENIFGEEDLPSSNNHDSFASGKDYPKLIVAKAVDGRSKCQSCKMSITKGSIRFGVQTLPKGEKEELTRWYHVRCSQIPKSVTDPKEVIHYKECGSALKRLIDDQFKKTKIEKIEKDNAAKKTSQASKKSSETAAKKKTYLEAAKSLGDLKVDELSAILRKNNQLLSGDKKTKLLRIGEGMTNGALPRCEECGGGYLHFNGAFDKVSCHGFRDDDKFVSCDFTSDVADIKRGTWVK